MGAGAAIGLTDDDLAAMRVPVHVLATSLGSWHAGPTVGMARALVARLPNPTLSVVEGYGTFLTIERPDLFGEHAEALLLRQAQNPGTA